MITWRQEYLLECDICADSLILDNIDAPRIKRPTPKTFKRIALKEGWKIEGDRCWCPKCNAVAEAKGGEGG